MGAPPAAGHNPPTTSGFSQPRPLGTSPGSPLNAAGRAGELGRCPARINTDRRRTQVTLPRRSADGQRGGGPPPASVLAAPPSSGETPKPARRATDGRPDCRLLNLHRRPPLSPRP